MDLVGTSGDTGPDGNLNRFTACSFCSLTPDSFRFAADEASVITLPYIQQYVELYIVKIIETGCCVCAVCKMYIVKC